MKTYDDFSDFTCGTASPISAPAVAMIAKPCLFAPENETLCSCVLPVGTTIVVSCPVVLNKDGILSNDMYRMTCPHRNDRTALS